MNFRDKMSLFQDVFEPLENIAVWGAILQVSKHEGVHSV
jgi:hypothetical protein